MDDMAGLVLGINVTARADADAAPKHDHRDRCDCGGAVTGAQHIQVAA